MRMVTVLEWIVYFAKLSQNHVCVSYIGVHQTVKGIVRCCVSTLILLFLFMDHICTFQFFLFSIFLVKIKIYHVHDEDKGNLHGKTW